MAEALEDSPDELDREAPASAPRFAARNGLDENALFRLLVQSVRDYAIFALDLQGRIVSWNVGAQRLKGYTADEIIGSHFSRFYPPEERAQADELLRTVERQGSAEREGWRVRKDGSRFWASVVMTALRNDAGQLVGFAKVTRDLTERKEAAKRTLAAREARARAEATEAERRLLESIVQAIDAGIALQDRTGRLIFATHGAARVGGFSSAAELVSTPIGEVMSRFEFFDERGRSLSPDELPNRAVMRGEPGGELVMRMRDRATGESRWTSVRSVPIAGLDGKVALALNIFRDVTELRREDGQRRLLVDAAHEFNSSIDYKETLANVARQVVPALADWCAIDLLEGQQLERLAVQHVDPEKIALVQEIERRFPSDPNAPGSARQVLLSGRPFLLETISQEILRAGARSPEQMALIERLELKSFLAVPITARNRPLGVLTLAMAESGRSYTQRDVGFALSLADRAGVAIDNARLFREKEAALGSERRAREAAEETSRVSELFIAVLGHDLRTPLNAIAVGAQYLLRLSQDERQRRPAARILSSTSRMARMIEQLLDLTRIRLGSGLRLELGPVNLESLIRDLLEETEIAFSSTFTLEKRGELLGTWDADRLGQAVSNLLSNAAQHGAGGGVLVHLDGEEPSRVRLTVRNPGEIPPELLAHLFDPFRGTKTRSPTHGLGLGLFITKEIVQAHGGSVSVRSAEGATEFTVELPREAKGAASATTDVG